ncbi:enoyl-CoA delta isomerase 3-like [Eucalyptus grandis]|uniref:enoyl-CoA delta isomerase 3-like n=1 Tax=Eucalyptus grandis TaxID=71139 RepID=UPI00192EE88B|nr:enoyl-CoA delta isomerase 3-like [Eucalyptus grandis]
MELQDRTWNPLASTEINKEDRFCELGMGGGGVFVLSFVGESHHRFSPAAICLINELLDSLSGCNMPDQTTHRNSCLTPVSRDEKARLLITTNQGKFFSDGMDVNYLGCTDRERPVEYLMSFQKLVSKLLTFHLPTIAVIRGHAVGVGCIFALAHDYRLMSSDHGYVFMNEVNLVPVGESWIFNC